MKRGRLVKKERGKKGKKKEGRNIEEGKKLYLWEKEERKRKKECLYYNGNIEDLLKKRWGKISRKVEDMDKCYLKEHYFLRK